MPSKQQPTEARFSLQKYRDEAKRARLAGETDHATLGRNVKAAREDLGMSQTELARYMSENGFTAWRQTTVSRTERGERQVPMGEAWALEQLFGGKKLWRDTRFGATMDGLVDGINDSLIEEKIETIEKELSELRELLNLQRRRRGHANG